jgi:spermidine synthase
MIGLGGGSIQRSFQHYYPKVQVDTVEIDPVVVQVARDFFNVKTSPTHAIHVADGRQFLENTENTYDAIILDAYSSKDGKSSIPFPLATTEFFKIVYDKLSPNGVLAYNVIGTVKGIHSKLPGAIMRSMLESFPRVYMAPATDSFNVVLLATHSKEIWGTLKIAETAERLAKTPTVRFPMFQRRATAIRPLNPETTKGFSILHDKNAPADGFLRTGF